MHTYVRKYVHTSIHRHIDTGIHRYMCISEHILAYVKCICHGLTAWTPLFRFSNSAGFGAAGLFGAAFPMMWWNPTRCFVACRTRQETQLEEGNWKTSVEGPIRLTVCFVPTNPCLPISRDQKKQQTIGDFGGIFGGVLGDFWWFEKKKVGEKVWYFLVFCDIDVVVNWPLTKDLRILWYGLPRCGLQVGVE